MSELWVLAFVVCVNLQSGEQRCEPVEIADPVISHFPTEKSCEYVGMHVDAYLSSAFTVHKIGGQLYAACKQVPVGDPA